MPFYLPFLREAKEWPSPRNFGKILILFCVLCQKKMPWLYKIFPK